MAMNEPEIATFLRQVTPLGLSILFVLWAMPRPLYETEIARLIGRERHTLASLIPSLEMFGFVAGVGARPRQRWTLTERARQLLLPGLMVEKLPLAPSSSSDQIRDQSDQSDQIEEEEEMEQKIYLCREYNLTGPKAEALQTDPWVTPLRLCAWLGQVMQMAHDKFPFRKSPEAYAIACLLRHDEPSRDALHIAYATLDFYLRQMPHGDDDEDDEDDEEEKSGGNHGKNA